MVNSFTNSENNAFPPFRNAKNCDIIICGMAKATAPQAEDILLRMSGSNAGRHTIIR